MKRRYLVGILIALMTVICLSLVAIAEDLPTAFQNFISDSRWSNGTTWSGTQPPKLSSYQGWGCCAYCADFTQYCFGNYNPRGGTVFYDTAEIRAGDVLTVGNQSDGTGHWFVCLKRNGNSLYVAEGNYGGKVRIGWNYSISSTHYFNEDSRYFTAGYHFMDEAEVRGSEMSQGYDRAIPDGDYLIAASGTSDKSTFYYLDIEGTAQPAAYDTNVSLCGPLSGDPPIYEIWTVTYNSSDKFYTIKQKGTNMCLDVYGANTLQGTNVKVYESNNSSAQKWAIERNGSNGYRLRPKCSGDGSTPMCLDIENGSISNGTQVRQWSVNNSNAQSWLFIPYLPSQPVEEGRYILLYNADHSYELDVAGDTGDIENNTNVQLWADTAPSEYNSFDVIPLSNGYYKIKHAASGKCLDVSNGLSSYKANVTVHDDNGSIAQQWAIMSNGSGYSLVSKCNGYALDLPDGTTGDGKNVEVYPRLNNTNQCWSFVQAEHTVTYDLNGGQNGPENQIKYYKYDLQISSTIPTKLGYKFTGWRANINNETVIYSAGSSYGIDEDVTFTAIWEPLTYTIIYDDNGGIGSPDGQSRTIDGGGEITLSTDVPAREGYDFLGWATSPDATAAEYQPGGNYPGGTATLYAVWRIKSFIVSFNSNGAGSFDSRTINWGDPIGELPEPVKDGYFFKGWIDGNGRKVSVDTIVKSNLTLTALWAEPSTMTLPAVLTTIEEEAFEGVDTNCFIIPATVTTIGSRAFANNSDLYTVIVYSRTVSPASDAFANCPNLTIVGYEDSPIQYYAIAKKIPFITIGSTSDWVLSTDVPVGSQVVDNKWTYVQKSTSTITSTATSLDGWTQTGEYTWEEIVTEPWKYASYPSGFDTGNSYYNKYNKSALAVGETITGNTKRVVASGSSLVSYIYWHWTLSNDYGNFYVNDFEGSDGSYEYHIFHAFEAGDLTNRYGMTTSGTEKTFDGLWSTYHYPEYSSCGPWWWYRFEIRQQTYTDYQKLFEYVKEDAEEMESSTEVIAGDDVTNVQHWVKYCF